jgi:deltex
MNPTTLTGRLNDYTSSRQPGILMSYVPRSVSYAPSPPRPSPTRLPTRTVHPRLLGLETVRHTTSRVSHQEQRSTTTISMHIAEIPPYRGWSNYTAPTSANRTTAHGPRSILRPSRYAGPPRLLSISHSLFSLASQSPSLIKEVHYNAPSTSASTSWSSAADCGLVGDTCAVCWDHMEANVSDSTAQTTVVKLAACGHLFHQACIVQALNYDPRCPSCRAAIPVTRGHMPCGTMQAWLAPSVVCQGFESAVGTIVIRYYISSGLQKPYHPQPGARHGSVCRSAYIPNTVEGRVLLKRLVYAFLHGLTFRIGVSSGCANSVTWASIPHKTSLSGGPEHHGFPDRDFFDVCNQELDALHVPAAVELG